MRILIISWFFPPANTMGALRMGKLADFLVREGHEVRVVTSTFQPESPPLDFVPNCRIVRTSWYDVNAVPRLVLQALRKGSRANSIKSSSSSSRAESGSDSRYKGGLRSWARAAYETFVNFPDKQVGWLPFALRAGRSEIADLQPDVVFATAPPFTGALVGRLIARRTGARTVIEMRDRWCDDPYRTVGRLRGGLERWLENRILAGSDGIVTVSGPWASSYAIRFDKPTVAVFNGFDPDDLARARALPSNSDENMLVIRHVGRIYPGRRDPSPLFKALAGMLPTEQEQIRVEFLGTSEGIVELAARHGVAENVDTLPAVGYHEALRRQIDADIVLLLQWNDPRERGNVPGKLFEYLATRRPILGHGDPHGVPADIIRTREAGLYANEPGEIQAFLRSKLAEKRKTGRVQDNSTAVYEGFERDTANRCLEAFLQSAVHGWSDWQPSNGREILGSAQDVQAESPLDRGHDARGRGVRTG